MANSTSNIDSVVQSQASKEVTINAFFDAASAATQYGRRQSTTSGLTWGFYGGNITKIDGTLAQIANGTLSLTASTTNYVVALKSTGAVSSSTTTTNWNNQVDYWRLYSIVTGTATITSYTDSRELGKYTGIDGADALLQAQISARTRMTGFPLNSSGAYLTTLTYNETTRTVTVTPTGSTFDVFVNGVGYTKTGAQTVVHAATGANHFIYYDATGTLVSSTTPWDLLLHAPVCFVFQDVTNSRRIPFEERHQAGRDVFWHRNQHAAEGTKATGSGFGLTGYTLATGTDAACTFAIASGRIEDEDIRVDSEAVADNGPYVIAERAGAAGDWQFTRNNVIPFLRTGTNTQYNQNTGATWQRTTLANNDHVNYYLFGATALPQASISPAPGAVQQFVIVPGQAKHATLAAANAENVANLSWGSVPFQEIAPLYKITLKYLSAAGGSTQIVELTRLVGTNASIAAAAIMDHGSLGGLTDLDHPASAIINTPSGSLAATDVQAALNELQSDVDGRQPLDGTLTALAGVTVAADRLIYATGADAFAVTTLTAAGRALLDDADAAAQRTTLGLGSAALRAASDTTTGVVTHDQLGSAAYTNISQIQSNIWPDAKSSTYAVTKDDNGRCLVVSGTTTITLPPAADSLSTTQPFSITIKAVTGAVVTVARSGSDTIETVAGNKSMTANTALTFFPTTTTAWETI